MPTSSHSDLTHKREKIVKCGERLLLHSYSFDVPQQCNWLTTLPYVLYRIPYHFPSSPIAPLLSDRRSSLPSSFPRFPIHRYARIYIHTYMYRYIVCEIVLLTAHLSASVSSRYKFIPLTLSFSFSRPSVSFFIFSRELFWVTHRFASNSPRVKHPPKPPRLPPFSSFLRPFCPLPSSLPVYSS